MTTVETTERRAYARPALVTGLLAAATLFVLNLVQVLVSFMYSLPYLDGTSGLYELDLGGMLLAEVGGLLFLALAFAVGLFLSFQYFAPVRSGLRLASVLRGAVVAAAIYAALRFVLALIVSVVPGARFDGGFFGYAFPGLTFDVGLADSVLPLAGQSIGAFASVLPLVTLAAVLLWLWLRGRPSDSGEPAASDAV